MNQLQEQILSDLIALLRNFNGNEYSEPIDETTFFFRDLHLASIDAVVLAERLETFYGQKFPFNAYLAKQKNTNTTDMQLSELVQFLSQHLKVHNDEV